MRSSWPTSEGKIRFWNPARSVCSATGPRRVWGAACVRFSPRTVSDKANAGYSHFANTGTGDLLNRTYEFAALRKDGSEFPIELSVSGFQIDGAWNAIAIVRDITERKQLAEAAEYRSTLLHAISVVAKELLTAAAIKGALTNALKTMGEAVHADRALIFENGTTPHRNLTFELRHGWHSAKALVIVDAALVATLPEVHATLGSRPSAKGKPLPLWCRPCRTARLRPFS